MPEGAEKICFVVMGFGRKTDYESGRTLDLDATYEAIIEPAVLSHGMRCIRADEVMHSGVIDLPMYEMLYHADLVIADISTGNVNAIYELGVRHALKPRATIIMSEDKGRVYFDLNHINTLKYRHLGDDIGVRDARTAEAALSALIGKVLAGMATDSPVYTFLPKLTQPSLSAAQLDKLVERAEMAQDERMSLMRKGESAIEANRFEEAKAAFARAIDLKAGEPGAIVEPYLIQRLALATYKSQEPDSIEALVAARKILLQLDPETSNDPETTGLMGAICKRLWRLTGERRQIDLAIRYYGRGFTIRNDYYNGENLALCYELRAPGQTDPDEARFDLMSAVKVRSAVIDIAEDLVRSSTFEERSDRKWIFATLANCYFAIGQIAKAGDYEERFLAFGPPRWEYESFMAGKQAVIAIHGIDGVLI
ncbi:hypothetical protein HZF05_07600 [Sphingomonas sp. CGMCC 1.13654]|uniref:DUF4071 domain-containing protein n=1 Tax=Sphingomonas chungangi TaxID=2683589 RepID=A0A838L3B0_9SPHN|nr:tetratricopeptide repeat-containing protein [Sphingomonas chungangi]MBA2933963.1 hypothetical protein [Sphingomonas chungangi]MVW57089.1 hypothetical protein [Sphingomonas chungangi]